jgi:hypothetical protein
MKGSDRDGHVVRYDKKRRSAERQSWMGFKGRERELTRYIEAVFYRDRLRSKKEG